LRAVSPSSAFYFAVLPEPGISGIADGGQRPGASISPFEARDRSKRAQACVLDHVFGIGFVAGEPARKRIRVGKMRQNYAGEV
jgi:hypothetical protein